MHARQYPCIIITGKGQPDVATRQFLKLIREELKIPVLGLMDSDPFGLKVCTFSQSGVCAVSFIAYEVVSPACFLFTA